MKVLMIEPVSFAVGLIFVLMIDNTGGDAAFYRGDQWLFLTALPKL
jgi:hypothetical protein